MQYNDKLTGGQTRQRLGVQAVRVFALRCLTPCYAILEKLTHAHFL